MNFLDYKNKLWSSCPCPGRSATGVRLWNLRSGSLPETGESSTCSSGSRCRSWSGWIGRTSQTSRCCKLTKIMIVEIYLVNWALIRRSNFMRSKFTFSWGRNYFCSWGRICSLIFDSVDQEVNTSIMRSKPKKALFLISISWSIC